MFWTLKQIKRFLNQILSYNMIPTINRLIGNAAAATYHFITDTVVDNKFKTGIIQTDLLDHFRIIFTLETNENMVETFIGDIVMKNQQTYLSKNFMKQHWITLRI